MRAKYEKIVQTLHLEGGTIFGNIALEAAYKNGAEWLSQLMDYLQENYHFLEHFILEKMPKVRIMKPEATFLVWLDLREYGLSESEMAKLLIHKAEVALNEGSRFGKNGEGFFRLNFACPKVLLEEGLNRIERELRKL